MGRADALPQDLIRPRRGDWMIHQASLVSLTGQGMHTESPAVP